MRAAWDWSLPRQTPADRAELVGLVTDLGFDTLIVGNPSADLVARAHENAIKVIAVVSPSADACFREQHPQCLQAMLPVEDGMAAALASARHEPFQRLAHRWFPVVQGSDLVCYEHQESRAYLRQRIETALENADGVALDGFGFRNHYACFCSRCCELHGAKNPERVATVSEESLVTVSDFIYQSAKSVKPEAVVTNHVWPPFNPNPYYGSRLRLDYCTQTISWFYKPNWSLERVELEASLHKKLEQPDRNTFVPFIGLFADEYQVRSADRVRRELEIAMRYGDGSVALCTLDAPRKVAAIRKVVSEILKT